MILKKYQARRLRPSNGEYVEPPASMRRGPVSDGVSDHGYDRSEGLESNPYSTQPLNSELFDQGVLVDRRRRGERRDDRRQDFRRTDDHVLLSTAENEGQLIREQARKEGFEAGMAECQAMIETLESQMGQFLSAREEALSSAGQDIAEIALEVTRHILKTEVSCDPELVISFVKRAIRDVGRQHKSVSIRVHPADYTMLNERYGDDTPIVANTDVTFIEDDSVDPGSCIIETVAGQIDKRFSTQLDVLTRLLQVSAAKHAEDVL